MSLDASKAGECSRCGNYLPLDDQGLCPACQGRPPCQNHPDRGAVGRCKGCKATFCRACMPQRLCHDCAATAPPEPRKKKGGTGALPEVAADAPKRRLPKIPPTQALIALVALLALVNGGLFAWRYLDQPSSTPEARMTQKLALVRSAVRNFKVEKERIPKTAAEVQAYLREAGSDLSVVGSEAEAGPGVFIYRLKGRSYEVFAKDEEGKVFRRAPGRGAAATP